MASAPGDLQARASAGESTVRHEHRPETNQRQGALAGEKATDGVSAGRPSVRDALVSARAGVASSQSRGVKRGRENDESEELKYAKDLSRREALLHFNICNPGEAPPIDALLEYWLFCPFQDDRTDLANPGTTLLEGQASYRLFHGLRGFTIKVLLLKKAFEIMDSPPPTASCKSRLNAKGSLTVGWRGDKKAAWINALQVIDQKRTRVQRPLALASNAASRASAGNEEEAASDATREQGIFGVFGASPGPLAGKQTGPLDKPESHGSVTRAIAHVCVGCEWMGDEIKVVGVEAGGASLTRPADVEVRGEPNGICTDFFPEGIFRVEPSDDEGGDLISTGDGFLAGEEGDVAKENDWGFLAQQETLLETTKNMY